MRRRVEFGIQPEASCHMEHQWHPGEQFAQRRNKMGGGADTSCGQAMPFHGWVFASFVVHHTSSSSHARTGLRAFTVNVSLQSHATERGVAVQVFDQVLDAIQVATK